MNLHTEADEALRAWRERALQVLLLVLAVIMLPPAAGVCAARLVAVPLHYRLIVLGLYASILVAASLPGRFFRGRTFLLLGCVLATAIVQLSAAQLAGSGRITLIVAPLLALVLVGERAGWITAAVCALLFATIPLLILNGWIRDLGLVDQAGAPPAFWVMQGVMWLTAMATLMILFTRFQVLQRSTMIDRHRALRRLEEESAARRRLEEEISRAGEEERRRLGSELHDGLCQHLTAVLLNVAALENGARDGRPPDPEGLARIHESMEQAIGMAYGVAKGLAPVSMDPDSLVPALERLCRDAEARHGVGCRLQLDREAVLYNPGHALHLYRIAQEAVANAVRHARGTAIGIDWGREGGHLVLRVRDNGRWCENGNGAGGGMGLDIMMHRARTMGGTLQVERAADGTCVTCRIPGGGEPA